MQCDVFVTCHHQAVFELSQETTWRSLERGSRIRQMVSALQAITPAVVAVLRQDTRETHTWTSEIDAGGDADELVPDRSFNVF